LNGFLNFLIEQGSYALMLAVLLVAGLGVPLPEDLVLLAAGVLLQRGITELPGTVLVIVAGVLVGDATIFLAARRLGDAAPGKPLFGRLLRPERRERLEALFHRYGGFVIFLARHLAGLRAPIFALAGMHRMRLWRFLLWDALGLTVSAPLVVGLGYFLSDRLEEALGNLVRAEHIILAVVLVPSALYGGWRLVRRRRDRA
jgi:membrane protein DedA with SNARE-associated domain